MLQLKTFTFNPFQENTYLISDSESKKAVLIDPGMHTDAERAELEKEIADAELTIKAIWLTHSHIDHVLGLRWAVERFGCAFYQSEEDAANLRSVPIYASMYGIRDFAGPDAEGIIIKDSEELFIGSHSFIALPTPGHAAGHLSFYNDELGVIAGDALFKGSIGRTDLPNGDFDILALSIKTQLYTLPGQTVVYPGHGPSTTIGQERRFNPFVRG